MTPILTGIVSSQISGRLGGGPVGSYDSLATITVPSGGLSSVTFSGIPTGYRHLQFRINSRTDMNSGGVWSPTGIRYNSDTGANYIVQDFYGIGSGSSTAESYSSQTSGNAGFGASSTTTANTFGSSIVDILDYASSSKLTVSRVISGVDNNGGGLVIFGGSTWTSTAPVTSITFVLLGGNNGSNFLQNTTFALYGVK